MNERELKMLQHNLTRSAKKADKYWVRGMVGFSESDQGFFPIEDVPVNNPHQSKKNTLAEFIKDSHSKDIEIENYTKDSEFKLKRSIAQMQENVNMLNAKVQELSDKYQDVLNTNERILTEGIEQYIKILGNL